LYVQFSHDSALSWVERFRSAFHLKVAGTAGERLLKGSRREKMAREKRRVGAANEDESARSERQGDRLQDWKADALDGL
jgi:hypothetical protein